MIREATKEDLKEILELYLHLHETDIPKYSEHLITTWNNIIEDKNHHLILNVVNNKIVSSLVCVIIPNMTRGVRSYALIENVVTHKDYRGKGYATECLNYAKEIALKESCFKLMLLTGAKDEETLNFYKSAGYNCEDKMAFIQWLR